MRCTRILSAGGCLRSGNQSLSGYPENSQPPQCGKQLATSQQDPEDFVERQISNLVGFTQIEVLRNSLVQGSKSRGKTRGSKCWISTHPSGHLYRVLHHRLERNCRKIWPWEIISGAWTHKHPLLDLVYVPFLDEERNCCLAVRWFLMV